MKGRKSSPEVDILLIFPLDALLGGAERGDQLLRVQLLDLAAPVGERLWGSWW